MAASTNDVIQSAIVEMVQKRGLEKTCCPSEVARKLSPTNWRELMEPVRDSARDLQRKGMIDICQKGVPVQSETWTGPIRLRLRPLKVNTGESSVLDESPQENGTGSRKLDHHQNEKEEPKARKRKHDMTT